MFCYRVLPGLLEGGCEGEGTGGIWVSTGAAGAGGTAGASGSALWGGAGASAGLALAGAAAQKKRCHWTTAMEGNCSV